MTSQRVPPITDRFLKALPSIGLFTVLLSLLVCGLLPPRAAFGQSTYASQQVTSTDEEAFSVDSRRATLTQPAPVLPTVREVPELGQNISVDLQGATLEEALDSITAQTNLKVAYLREAISAGKQITMNDDVTTVLEALRSTIRGTDLRLVQATDDQLVLTERANPLGREVRTAAPGIQGSAKHVSTPKLATFTPKQLQQGTIAGTVTDASTGNPLPGVNVVIEETQEGASTAPDGTFEIAGIEAGSYTVRASFVGYRDAVREGVQVRADETTTINFSLQRGTAGLQEVVVVGYGQEQRRDLTGSISSVDAGELEETASASFDQALQGKVAGVRIVQSNGAPGAAPIVRVRGRTSILGNSQPLYVVDGVPIGRGGGGGGESNPLATIDPNDIASIDVLKDASATAIYGARGSNGVIQITTKGGEAGQRRVNFGTNVGVSNMKTLDAMNASQYVEVANDRAENGGLAKPFPNGVPEGASDTDWSDVVTRTGLTQEYSMSVSGGDETGTYRVAGSFRDEEGTIKNSGLRRASFRVNLEEEIGNFSISPRLSVSRVWEDQRGNGVDQRDTFEPPPILSPRQEDGSFTTFSTLSQFPFSPPTENPLAETQLGVDEDTQDRILGNITLEYQLMDGLTAQVQGGADVNRSQSDFFNPQSAALNTTITSAAESRFLGTRWLAEGRLTFDRTVATNHDLSVTGVATWEKERGRFLSASAEGFVSDALENNNLAAGERAGTPQNNTSESTLISYVGRADYTWLDRYLLTLTGRIDGSSVFGAQNKWGAFPSAAIGWRISEEEFLQDIDAITNLKLRLSWGISGNQAIAPYQTLAQYTPTDVAFNRSRQVGLYVSGIPNPNLNWETTEQFNVGVNASFLDQRYSVSLDLYTKETQDLLANVPLPQSSGFGTTLRNIGRIQNRGIEFQFDAAILTGDIGWTLGGNISANRNEVKKLARGSDIESGVGLYGAQNLAREGEPIGAFFGLELANPPLREDGLFNYVDQNGDGNIDSDDRRIIGSPYPDFTYGLNSAFRYEGFRLTTFIQGSQGKEIFSRAKDLIGDSMHRGRNQIAEVFNNRWTRENKNRNAEYPKAFPNLNKDASEWQLEDASYLRIKEVRLGYNLPVDQLNLPLRSANIYVSGQNIAEFSPYEFFSPDSQTTGGNSLNVGVHDVVGYYPFSRTYTVGVDFGF